MRKESLLTNWCLSKILAISQKTFSNTFSWNRFYHCLNFAEVCSYIIIWHWFGLDSWGCGEKPQPQELQPMMQFVAKRLVTWKYKSMKRMIRWNLHVEKICCILLHQIAQHEKANEIWTLAHGIHDLIRQYFRVPPPDYELDAVYQFVFDLDEFMYWVNDVPNWNKFELISGLTNWVMEYFELFSTRWERWYRIY